MQRLLTKKHLRFDSLWLGDRGKDSSHFGCADVWTIARCVLVLELDISRDIKYDIRYRLRHDSGGNE
jgi:hypothetical protein